MTTSDQMVSEVHALLESLSVPRSTFADGNLQVQSPITGTVIGHVSTDSTQAVEAKISAAHQAHLAWRAFPAPHVVGALLMFLAQLALNFFWSVIFFHWRRPDAAFVDLLLMWLAIVATISRVEIPVLRRISLADRP